MWSASGEPLRLGDGQAKTKTFPDEAAARKEVEKLVREKTAKGYRETT
jgi:predicted DNA-binding WGR domain protein